jgi:hypothetical protein
MCLTIATSVTAATPPRANGFHNPPKTWNLPSGGAF